MASAQRGGEFAVKTGGCPRTRCYFVELAANGGKLEEVKLKVLRVINCSGAYPARRRHVSRPFAANWRKFHHKGDIVAEILRTGS